jgi:hypothetical protein
LRIVEANNARRLLTNKYGVKKIPLKDDRKPRRPVTAYFLFVRSRWESGDYDGQEAIKANEEIVKEWAAMDAAARQVCCSRLSRPIRPRASTMLIIANNV